MHFRILGPLEVWADGHELQLGAGRQRALLTLLLLHANEVVPSDRLIDELWGERPPATASKVVQGYVSQLRKALAEDVLVTRPPGYLLRVDATDAREFERLVDEAQGQEPAEAARTLRRALELWRGPPLADFEYENWAQAEIARLEELRLEAVEDRIDAELQLGRHAQLVPELESLAAAHPLRERVRGQLMLALYRSGRQAEALDEYAEARRQLVGELGIEPGLDLQELQRRILAHDPELGPAARPRPLATRRRARWLIGAGALLLIGAAALLAVELIDRGGSSVHVSSVVPDSLAVLDPKTKGIVGQVRIPGGPSLVAAGPGVVWVAGDVNRTISSISADGREVTHVIAGQGTPNALASEGNAVWVLDGNRRMLLKIDPTYGAVTRRITLPRAPPLPASNRRLSSLSVSAGAGALWVTDGSTRLLRVDPGRGEVSALDVAQPLDAVAVGEGAVWAISGRAASLFQIDPQARSVRTRIPIVNRLGTAAPFPIAIAVGEGSVWVLNGNTQTVSRIDPNLGGVAATIPLGIGRNPNDLAVGLGAVWVANGGDGTLTRIDPNTNLSSNLDVGGSPTDVAVGGGRVWVTVQPGFRSLARNPVQPLVGAQGQALPASRCSPVEFAGKGQPRYLIASDLPFQGQSTLAETLQMSDAVRLVLAQHHFRAGPYSIGYQSCDNSIASTGSYDVARCKANAQAYAASKSVIGVVGGYNSGCTQAQLAALAGASGGPLAIVGTASTYVGLTHTGPGTSPAEPQKYRPDGKRSFVRVVAADDIQGAANALLAKRLGVTRLYVLNYGDPYGAGIASNVRRAATKLGLAVVGFEGWNPHGHDFTALARRIRHARADGVFLGGTGDLSNGPGLVKGLRFALGDRVHILAPDGFTPFTGFVRLAGPAAEGMTISFTATPPERLGAEGRRFAAEFRKAIGRPIQGYSLSAAQATEVLLDAIARSDGSRASVTAQVFKTRVSSGILGSFSFDRNGDTTAGAVTIYRIVHGLPTVMTVITPSRSLLGPGG
jgi:DNA-binding SARP family transcriptional activator/ABC-type branched-subunit amino acid transport system substrate-binding protein/streptogramin lyase